MRLAVYCDFPYRRHGGRVYAEQAFVLFLLGLREHLEALVLLGRLDPTPASWHFELPPGVQYEPLAHYGSLAEPLSVLRAIAGSMRSFWRVLGEVDTVWLFGPNPLAVLFALLAAVRGRAVVLGVRQDYLAYVEKRHPGNARMRLAARLLDGAFKLIPRRAAVLVVGPRLAEGYAQARRLGVMTIALSSEQDLVDPSRRSAPEPGAPLTVLSVGRLDNEKNPLILAEALALVRDELPGLRLWVCGEGPLEEALRERLQALGVAERARLLGFVPAGPALTGVYRESDVFLHTSLTEGVPQVLFEAFAAALPVIATDVGAVAETVGDAALLVPPADAPAVAAALRRLAADPSLRERLELAGAAIARRNTIEARCREVAEFLGAGAASAHADRTHAG